MYVEIVRFTAAEDAATGLVEGREAMLAALRERFPGLRSAMLTRVDATSWYDLVVWEELEHARRAAQEMPSIPAAAAWAARIKEVLVFEHAHVVHELAPVIPTTTFAADGGAAGRE